MKKKMSTRELAMITVLGFALFGYGFYSFLWSPMEAEKTVLLEEKNEIESKVISKNIEGLNKEIISLENEAKSVDFQLEEIKSNREFGAMDYQELLAYLGNRADTVGVDMTDFEKLEFNDRKVYWETPYEVTVQGEYMDIINFVNSVYQLDNYFYLTSMDLREISRIPMTDDTLQGESSLREKILFEWAPEFMNALDEEIPSELRAELEENYENEYQEAMSRIEEEKEKSFKLDEKLQLTFTFHFITLEEPVE